MKKTKKTKAEIQKLVNWISANRDDWELICGTTGQEISAQRLRKILDSLIERSLYQIALVAITACRWNIPVSEAIEKTVFSALTEEQGKKHTEKVIRQISGEIRDSEQNDLSKTQ